MSSTGPSADRDPQTALSVLVIDDEALVLSTLRRLLETAGYRVATASSGAEALQIAERTNVRYQVAFVDVTLEDLDCAELSRKLRVVQPDIRVILTSGYGREDVAGRLEASRAEGFVQKPFVAKALKKAIAEVAGGADRSRRP